MSDRNAHTKYDDERHFDRFDLGSWDNSTGTGSSTVLLSHHRWCNNFTYSKMMLPLKGVWKLEQSIDGN